MQRIPEVTMRQGLNSLQPSRNESRLSLLQCINDHKELPCARICNLARYAIRERARSREAETSQARMSRIGWQALTLVSCLMEPCGCNPARKKPTQTRRQRSIGSDGNDENEEKIFYGDGPSIGRVAGRHCCLPAPQEPYMILSHHT